jgi:hypothetical protein
LNLLLIIMWWWWDGGAGGGAGRIEEGHVVFTDRLHKRDMTYR